MIFLNLVFSPELLGTANYENIAEKSIPNKIEASIVCKKELSGERNAKNLKVVENEDKLTEIKDKSEKEIRSTEDSFKSKKGKLDLNFEKRGPSNLDLDSGSKEVACKYPKNSGQFDKNKGNYTVGKKTLDGKDGIKDLKFVENKNEVGQNRNEIAMGKSNNTVKYGLEVKESIKNFDLKSEGNSFMKVNYKQSVPKNSKNTTGSFKVERGAFAKKVFLTVAKYLLVAAPIYLTLLYFTKTGSRNGEADNSRNLKENKNMEQNSILSESKALVKIDDIKFEKSLEKIKFRKKAVKNNNRKSNKSNELERRGIFCQCKTNFAGSEKNSRKNKKEFLNSEKQKDTWHEFSLDCVKKVLSVAVDKMLNLVPFYLLMRLY